MVSVNKPTCTFNEKSFTKFCSAHNITFPESFVNYLREHNDAELDPNILGFQDNECTIRFFYGITSNEYTDIRKIYEWYESRLPNNCFPIADPDFGNLVCMSMERTTYGKIYFWDHEIMDTDEDESCDLRIDNMILLADSFDQLLDKIVASPY